MSHRIDTGILVAGEVQCGTEWVLRDSRAWWDGSTHDARPRGSVRPRLIVGHWTGGPHREGPDAAHRIVRAMDARRREDGSDMSVSCGFIISWDGLCWQTADLDMATIHVGDRVTYRRSIGVEIAWCGYERQARRLGIDGVHILPRAWDGQRLSVVRPSDTIVETWVRLCETLATICGIPRRVPATQGRSLPMADVRTRDGAIEHCHLGNQDKRDTAGLLVDALAARGWERA